MLVENQIRLNKHQNYMLLKKVVLFKKMENIIVKLFHFIQSFSSNMGFLLIKNSSFLFLLRLLVRFMELALLHE